MSSQETTPNEEGATSGMPLTRDDGSKDLLPGLTASSADVTQGLPQKESSDSHEPTVTWNHVAKRAAAADTAVPVVDDVPSTKKSEQERSSASRKIFSLLDLHKASPLEEEAETSILKSIEERESQSFTAAGSHLLAPIPDHAMDSFRRAAAEEERRAAAEEERRAASESATSHPRQVPYPQDGQRTSKKAPPQSLESQLAGLTAAMRLMQAKRERDAQRDVSSGAPKKYPQNQDGPVEFTLETHVNEGPGNSLMNNANILYRRKAPKDLAEAEQELKSSVEASVRSKEDQGRDDASASGYNKGANDDVDVEYGEKRCGVTTNRPCQGNGSHGWVPGLRLKNFADRAKEDWTLYSEFIRPRRETIIRKTVRVILFLLVPLIAIAFWLFYGLDNPGLGRQGASTSWFLLFLARHVIAGYLARATQIFLIDYLALRKLTMVRILGPFWTLCLVQSRGFPFLFSSWALYGFLLLSGSNRFARHWLFYQDFMPIFNESNPAGTLTASSTNFMVLTSALVFGIVVSFKRVYLGLHYGKQACRNYGEELAKVIRDVLLVSEVAGLAMHLEKRNLMDRIRFRQDALTRVVGDNALDHPDLDVSATMRSSSSVRDSLASEDKRRNPYNGSLSQSQKNEIMSLLESWDEPETAKTVDGPVSLSTVLEFRSALALISNTEFPFSMEFGSARDRESCVESSQKVYNNLMVLQQDEGGILDFDTIALVATDQDGEIDRIKMKELIRLFRPERDGYLSKLDFVKSVDSVYKHLRLLSASIVNAGQIDRASGNIINWIFYTVYLIIMLSVFGFDPMALFLSLSSIIVAFAFMIGNASAKYFEGLLFVLVRRPYNIGDRIHVSPVDEDTNANGSNTWFVESVDLFTTTIRYATTNEVATVANGSLATSRVINAARSPKMLVYVYMKFGVDVPYQKVKLFRRTVEQFVKKRPRDWLSLSGFRATRVEVELGFIEYVMVLQHRERWQNIVPMLDAKAEFSSFALEAAKKLEMRYTAPSLPVDLSMASKERMREHVADLASANEDLDEMMRASDPSNRTEPDMSDLKDMFFREQK